MLFSTRSIFSGVLKAVASWILSSLLIELDDAAQSYEELAITRAVCLTDI